MRLAECWRPFCGHVHMASEKVAVQTTVRQYKYYNNVVEVYKHVTSCVSHPSIDFFSLGLVLLDRFPVAC